MSRDGGASGCVPGWAGTNYAWSRTTSIGCRTPSPRRDIAAVMDSLEATKGGASFSLIWIEISKERFWELHRGLQD